MDEQTNKKILKLRKEMYVEVGKILDQFEKELLWLVHKNSKKRR
jgi:hypothetical protein